MSETPTGLDKREPPAHLEERSPPSKIELARELHGKVLPAEVYSYACRQRLTKLFGDVDASAGMGIYAEDMIKRMAPSDPAEEMLVVQMLLAHARVMHLTSLANGQEGLDAVRIVNEYADRASNTLRRLALALAEYRRPSRRVASYTAIGQANIAGQQVVMSGETSADGKTTNEQGCDTRAEPGAAKPALPAEPRGAGIPSGIGAAREAVEVVNRPPDTRGKGPKPQERMEAR